jgi:hypothetical protein
MAFYAGRVVLHPAMQNPTLVVITDRNDLDDQLFGTFSKCHELLRQHPVQATSRAHLRELLKTASGGVIFTTIHKFSPIEANDQEPLLSGRRNIVVMADEAHRSQYDFIDGFAPKGLVYRLYGDAYRTGRRQHPERVRRLYQCLRHRAGGAGWGHRADLLREPTGAAGVERIGAADAG